ncbi:MAG: HDOD domain-containing protein [Thermodesulfobacteriota bacterium]
MSVEEKYIAAIDNLVPRPDIALDVLRIAHNRECDISKLARTIEQDPNLTASMLKMANSSYFGHMREISSIRDIIVRLGFDAVKLLAITGAAAGILSSPQEAYDLEPRDLWHHSLACAILAALVADHAGVKNTFSVYTAALLHDIGKVVLNRPLLARWKENPVPAVPSLVALEQALLGTDHARVGQYLLTAWGLPAAITTPVGMHHEHDANDTSLATNIVRLANFVVESLGIRFAGIVPPGFAIDEFLAANDSLPDIPGFSVNAEKIMATFLQHFNDTAFPL